MGVLFIFVACLLWALDTLIRYPLIYGGFSATHLVLIEHLILCTGLITVIIRLFKEGRLIGTKNSLPFFITGGLGSALATLAFTKAFSLTNPSVVIMLQKLQPLVAIAMANRILKEPLKKEYFGWAILCLIGGVLMSFKEVSSGTDALLTENFFGQDSVIGLGLTLLAVFGWGTSTVFSKKLFAVGYSDNEIMGGRFFYGLIFLLPALVGGDFSLMLDISILGKIILMVLLSGFLGMKLYYMGLKEIPARLCALAEMFFPFCAIAVNWIFLGAKLDGFQIMGGIFLLIGSTILQLKRY